MFFIRRHRRRQRRGDDVDSVSQYYQGYDGNDWGQPAMAQQQQQQANIVGRSPTHRASPTEYQFDDGRPLDAANAAAAAVTSPVSAYNYGGDYGYKPDDYYYYPPQLAEGAYKYYVPEGGYYYDPYHHATEPSSPTSPTTATSYSQPHDYSAAGSTAVSSSATELHNNSAGAVYEKPDSKDDRP